MDAAFLELYLDIKMYINWPNNIVELGFNSEEQKRSMCVQLRRCIYRNVDSALHIGRKIHKVLGKGV